MAALIRLQKHLISFNSFTIKAPCRDVICNVLLWSHALWKYLLCSRQQWETFISVDLTVQVSYTNSGKESQDVSVVWTAALIIGRFNGLMSVSGGSWWDGSAIIAFAQTRHTKGWRLQMSGHLITKSRPRVFIESHHQKTPQAWRASTNSLLLYLSEKQKYVVMVNLQSV